MSSGGFADDFANVENKSAMINNYSNSVLQNPNLHQQQQQNDVKNENENSNGFNNKGLLYKLEDSDNITTTGRLFNNLECSRDPTIQFQNPQNDYLNTNYQQFQYTSTLLNNHHNKLSNQQQQNSRAFSTPGDDNITQQQLQFQSQHLNMQQKNGQNLYNLQTSTSSQNLTTKIDDNLPNLPLSH